jgi:hypothetical protein
MQRPLAPRAGALIAAIAALPASAHFAGAAPHWHAGDIWGVLAVVALTAIAACVDRRVGRVARIPERSRN